jgi:hypothetical protein
MTGTSGGQAQAFLAVEQLAGKQSSEAAATPDCAGLHHSDALSLEYGARICGHLQIFTRLIWQEITEIRGSDSSFHFAHEIA